MIEIDKRSADVIRPDFSKRRTPRPPKDGRGKAPVVIEHDPKKDPHCSHDYVAVYSTRRKVVCRGCGASVDPIDVLEKLVRQWDWATYHEAEITKRRAEVETLKREIANLKAQRRRAGRRTA